MRSRNNSLSKILAFTTLMALLGGCIAGTTVRTGSSSSSSGSPSPGSSSSSASPSPGASGSATPTPNAGNGLQTIIDPNETNNFDIAQDDNYIYYTVKNPQNGLVLAISKGGGTPIMLASGGNANTPWGIDCDPGSTGYVYYTDHLATPNGAVYRVPKPAIITPGGSPMPNGTPQQLATGLNLPTFIRLDAQPGGDGLLYTCENVQATGRILRFSTSQPGQNPTSDTFITASGNGPPPFNLHLFTVNNVVTLFMSMMASGLTTGTNGQILSQPITAPSGTIAQANLIATGLINPTDMWLAQIATGNTQVVWTEYDSTSGSVRATSVNSSSARGTTIGTVDNTVVQLPPVSIKVDQNLGVAVVSRNSQQVNGGGMFTINLSTNVATNINVAVNTNGTVAQGGGANYPFQFVANGNYGIFLTEFNYSSGDTGTTFPSRLVELGETFIFRDLNQTPGNFTGFNFNPNYSFTQNP